MELRLFTVVMLALVTIVSVVFAVAEPTGLRWAVVGCWVVCTGAAAAQLLQQVREAEERHRDQ